MANYDRLSPQDSSFLYWEAPNVHMHVGGLIVYDDTGFTMEDVYKHAAERMQLVPRFRKKLMFVPYNQGRPIWVDDDSFEIAYHVRHTALPDPQGERELYNLFARIMSSQLDRTRPLWEMWIVDMPGDQRAMIYKTHHALIDGVSGVDLAAVILDITPEGREVELEEWIPEPPPTPTQLLADTMLERLTQPAEMYRAIRGTTRTPREWFDRAKEIGKGIGQVTRVPFEAAPKTSLAKQKGGYRRFDVASADLAAFKAIKNEHDTTVNDVVLAVVSGGLRKFLIERGDDVEDLVMKAAVPVSTRDESDEMSMGNKVSAMFAELPVGVADPFERLRRVRVQMGDLKDSLQALGTETMMKLADFAPPSLIGLAGRAVANQWVMNLTVTNVPGPQFPLYFMGGKIHEILPFVPLVGATSVGVAVLSYEGKIRFGLTADWGTVPDLHVLTEGIEKSIAELGA